MTFRFLKDWVLAVFERSSLPSKNFSCISMDMLQIGWDDDGGAHQLWNVFSTTHSSELEHWCYYKEREVVSSGPVSLVANEVPGPFKDACMQIWSCS